jgi:DNA-binding NarL/FixJ family response regulator
MPPHILIVDADVSAAQITAAVVQHIAPAATVTVERTPARAWLSFQHRPPDVLIVDPAPQGPTDTLLIQLLKQERPQAHVIVVASEPTPALRRKLHDLTVEAYLEKPTPLAVLADHLRALFQPPD